MEYFQSHSKTAASSEVLKHKLNILKWNEQKEFNTSNNKNDNNNNTTINNINNNNNNKNNNNNNKQIILEITIKVR